MKNDDVMCGGIINNYNYDAPKEIKSKDIIKMSMSFFLFNSWGFREGNRYNFSIEKDKSGNVFLSDNIDKILVDEEVLKESQKIIDDYELVKLNGINEYSSGLPYEYSPMNLSVDYESGERLQFCQDGYPTSKWAKEFVKLFGNEFNKNGFDRYMPPKETTTLTRFDVDFDRDDKHYLYAELTYDENTSKFLRSVYDRKVQDSVDDEIDITDEMYVKVGQIIDDNGFTFINYDEDRPEVESKDYIYLEFQDGRAQRIEKIKGNEERFEKVLNEITNYLDTLFDKKGKQ